jgi:CheY-like chemotaxis protein
VTFAPPTVLIVDDEPAVRWLLQQGLPPFLPGFALATVANGQEAIDYLEAYPVDALVTDIAMPVKDGFDLLAHVRNHRPELPVVVLATMTPREVSAGAPQLGTLHVLQKPASPELVARHLLQARSAKGGEPRTGAPLATLLELMRLERKTCALLVRAGDQKGRLHFVSGELVNAYAFGLDVEGEDAARHLLALQGVTIDFERSLHNHVRTIHTALETLLLDAAAPPEAAIDPPAAAGPRAAAAAEDAADAGARRPGPPALLPTEPPSRRPSPGSRTPSPACAPAAERRPRCWGPPHPT